MGTGTDTGTGTASHNSLMTKVSKRIVGGEGCGVSFEGGWLAHASLVGSFYCFLHC